MPNTELKSGPPIFRRQDSVGALRHLVIIGLDGLAIYMVGIGFNVVSDLVPISESATWLPGVLFFAFAWWYLAVLKPSRFRSPGYWIADAKIITIHGEAPTPWRMTLRFLWIFFWLFGFPINFIVDLAWTAVDSNRQMLRDVIAETRLIRNKAQPIAVGRLSRSLVLGLGLAIFYTEVREYHSTRTKAEAA